MSAPAQRPASTCALVITCVALVGCVHGVSPENLDIAGRRAQTTCFLMAHPDWLHPSAECERVFWDGLLAATSAGSCELDQDCVAYFFPEGRDPWSWFAVSVEWSGRSEFRDAVGQECGILDFARAPGPAPQVRCRRHVCTLTGMRPLKTAEALACSPGR